MAVLLVKRGGRRGERERERNRLPDFSSNSSLLFSLSHRERGPADTEMKVTSVEKRSPFKDLSESEYSHKCYAPC